MASLRRTHALFLAAAIVLIYILFFSGSETTDFRKVTESSLSSRRGILRGSLSDAELTAQTNQQLQMILDKQREASIAGHGSGTDIAGTTSNSKGNEKPKYPIANKSADANPKPPNSAVVKGSSSNPKDNGEERAREELHDILKRSPSTFEYESSSVRSRLTARQSSSFPSPTVHIRSGQRHSFSKLIPSHLLRMLSSLIL